ncbi:hypothetical protein LTR08_001891 [Meristemomyces frigidus]|nr:hypothetical protein LTR08_001891 [Meristemomyces frigidus]
MPFSMNPEVGAAMANLFGTNPSPPPAVGDVEARRTLIAGLFGALQSQAPSPSVSGVDSEDFYTQADDGHTLLCRWFTKQGVELSDSPAVCFAHGGGMICLNVDNYGFIIENYVARTGVPFLAIDYRLAPEVHAPVPVTDVYAGLQYLHSHATELGVNPDRIAVMGDSAGGGIAASVAHYAKSKGTPAICKQILIYPMLDDRNTELDEHIAPFALFSTDDNKTGWGALLGDRLGGDSVTPIEAAGRMTVEDAKGLPPAYIDVGELDIFREEDLQYALKLSRAQVSCEFHLLPAVPHAFEGLAPDSEVSKTTMDNRYRAIMSF